MRIFLMENNKRPLCIIRVTGSRTHDGPRCWWGVEQRELLSIVGGDTERCRRRGGQRTTAQRTEHAVCHTQPGSHMPWYLPKELWLYCQKLEATKISFSRRMDKQIMKHPDDGVLLLLLSHFSRVRLCATP